MNELEPALARVIAAYRSAVAARDIEAFIHLYDPAVRVFDTWGVWSYEDASAWQVAIEGWFASHPNDQFKVDFDEVATTSTPAFATLSAIVTYAVVSAQGEPINTMQNRLTWVLKTSGHVPRIVHEHTSAPVGYDDGKAMLQRAARA